MTQILARPLGRLLQGGELPFHNSSCFSNASFSNCTVAEDEVPKTLRGALADLFKETTAIIAVCTVGAVVLFLIGRQFWRCRQTQLSNKVYWHRMRHVRTVSERAKAVSLGRDSIAASWSNPLSAVPARAAAELDLDTMLPVTQSKPHWGMSSIVAPTLTKAAIAAAAMRISVLEADELSASVDEIDTSEEAAIQREYRARAMRTGMRAVAARSTPKYMTTTVGFANRALDVPDGGEGGATGRSSAPATPIRSGRTGASTPSRPPLVPVMSPRSPPVTPARPIILTVRPGSGYLTSEDEKEGGGGEEDGEDPDEARRDEGGSWAGVDDIEDRSSVVSSSASGAER
jgi:hypothetical protein